MVPPLVTEIRAALTAAADPVKAPSMQRYMKSAMPFLGVQAPVHKQIVRAALAACPPHSAREWKLAVDELWKSAEFREERYAAIAIAGWKQARPWQTADMLTFYRRMVEQGAWWDYSDALAQRFGELLLDHGARARQRLKTFSTARSFWTRRVSIIAQLALKERTDVSLLYGNIERNWHDREFFVCKAIGWALRSYSKVDPAGVERFVTEHTAELSGLSVREAMKHIERQRDKTPRGNER